MHQTILKYTTLRLFLKRGEFLKMRSVSKTFKECLHLSFERICQLESFKKNMSRCLVETVTRFLNPKDKTFNRLGKHYLGHIEGLLSNDACCECKGPPGRCWFNIYIEDAPETLKRAFISQRLAHEAASLMRSKTSLFLREADSVSH